MCPAPLYVITKIPYIIITCIIALRIILKINGSHDKFQLGLSVAVGFSSVILWTLLILLPLAQV